MWFTKNKGLMDSVADKDRRVGIIFLNSSCDSWRVGSYNIVDKVKNPVQNHNTILEVKEIFNDKDFSKVEIIKISYNKSELSNRRIIKIFDNWILSNKVHWLVPSIPVDRNNKLNEILS